MNISYKWLRDLCDATLPPPRELADRLTMVGLAVDAVHEAGDDYVLDFDIGSNRPDCLSHLGVAREAAVMLRGVVRLPDAQPAATDGRTDGFASVEIEDAALCPRYTARVVRGVRVAPSPAWLAERLQAIGQRPINNVADITNYVLHELGQPIHAFDLNTLAERRIIVRRARAGERLRTLDGVERVLDEEMLVIADGSRAVALAGVMGGEETEVTDATRDVLIESAYFNPESVRRTARVLGLNTEASYRFERGVDYEGALMASERCAALICELAGGTATEDAIDVYSHRPVAPVVRMRFARVKALTSLDVAPEESVRILTALGLALRAEDANGSEAASFVAPTWRRDIEREEDLVEEVARHAGYEKIQDELPAGNVAGEFRPWDKQMRAARLALTANGFDEAISFSFIDAAHDGRFELLPTLLSVKSDAVENENGSSGNNEIRLVSLSNPIIEDATRMRPTLLPGLLDAVRHNFNHGTRNVRLFELGRVFRSHEDAAGSVVIDERESFALVLTGSATEEGRAAGAARELDFYDLKGALEAAADTMNVGELEFAATSARHLREGQAASVSVGGQAVGTLGRLAEELNASYKFRQPVYVAEVDFGSLLSSAERVVRYTPLARFPSIVRDISLLIERRTTFAELKRAALAPGIEECRGVSLVDVFEGANLPEGKRSVTLRLEYRADERTLRDQDVDVMHARIIEALKENSGAQIRG
ncbi:MAG TPA: phenylalanine--tRNA ligase subunit beta [Pyrinomonadaceae bacterium]|jgi:phenylalanyl-tRNA synthetase beta chain